MEPSASAENLTTGFGPARSVVLTSSGSTGFSIGWTAGVRELDKREWRR
jgi:hypothetical protein